MQFVAQKAHGDVGVKKDALDAAALLEAEAARDGRGLAWGSSKENSHPLAVPPLLAARVTWV